MNITLEQLRSLEAIAAGGSFSAAAKALNKAQSAVSRDIAQLEAGLAISLFDRSGHRAKLTREGEALVAEGRVILARSRDLEHLAQRFSEGWEPRLKVIIDGILPMEPIMIALKTLAEEKVPTRITTRVEFLGGVQDRFEKDKADLMLVNNFHRRPGLDARALPRQESVLVAASSHPLAEGDGETLKRRHDLHEYVQLTVQDSSNNPHNLDPYLFGGPRVYYLSDFYTKQRALLTGLGYGWMPMHLAASDLASGKLVELKLDEATRYYFEPRMVTRVSQPLGRAGRRFLHLIQESFPPSTGP